MRRRRTFHRNMRLGAALRMTDRLRWYRRTGYDQARASRSPKQHNRDLPWVERTEDLQPPTRACHLRACALSRSLRRLRREDFWFIVAVRSEDEAEIRAG